jgi:hypothetical protein
MSRPPPTPPLIVLRVTLTFWKDDPQVEFALMHGAEAADDSERIGPVEAKSLGAPASLRPDSSLNLNLPPHVLEGLRAGLAKEPKTLPLWLRFAKPHGYLGVLPWERVLTEALARPVLRLPDLLERPCENRDVLEFAVCFDASDETEQGQANEQIGRLADAILRASPRSQTRVHLFTTADWFARLRATKLDSRIQFHDPAKAPTYREASKQAFARNKDRRSARQQPPESPWSIWISKALKTRSLDAIHFICSADVTDLGPALRMSASPSSGDKMGAVSYTHTTELAALMTRMGAWAALFSPPPDGRSGATLALAADALAHTQPASVLYQPLVTSEQALALRDACAFLFSPDPTAAPLLHDGFLYGQPTSVADYDSLEIPPVLAQINPAGQDFRLKQIPKWAVAMQRHLETVALKELRRRSPDVLLATAESVRAQVDEAARSAENREKDETLAEIQKVVSDYVQRSRK